MATASKTAQEEVLKSLEPFSKALSKTVGQIWRMFVMRYIAKGIGEIFLSVFIVWIGWYVLDGTHRLWLIPFLVAAGLFVYDAIQLLIDPQYFAMNDVAVRVKSESLFLKGK